MTGLIVEISKSSAEQAQNFNEINTELVSVNNVTQDVMNEAQSSAAIANDLSSRSSNLQILLNQFET